MFFRSTPNNHIRAGFTVIEILIVITVIGLLTVVAVPKFIGLKREAEISATRGALGTIRGALLIYYAKTAVANGASEYPTGFSNDMFASLGYRSAMATGPQGGGDPPVLASGLTKVTLDVAQPNLMPFNELTSSNVVVSLSRKPNSLKELKATRAGWWYVPQGYAAAGSVGAFIPNDASSSAIAPDPLTW